MAGTKLAQCPIRQQARAPGPGAAADVASRLCLDHWVGRDSYTPAARSRRTDRSRILPGSPHWRPRSAVSRALVI
jgi:hypothetical protein